jgi:hypothetical protein
MPPCECWTKNGKPCRNSTVDGLTVCASHRDHPCDPNAPRSRSKSRGRSSSPRRMLRCECFNKEYGNRCENFAMEGLNVCSVHRDYPCANTDKNAQFQPNYIPNPATSMNPTMTTMNPMTPTMTMTPTMPKNDFLPQKDPEMDFNQLEAARLKASKETQEAEQKLMARFQGEKQQLEQESARVKQKQEELMKSKEIQNAREKEDLKQQEEVAKQFDIQREAKEKQESEIALAQLKHNQEMRRQDELRRQKQKLQDDEMIKRDLENRKLHETEELNREAAFLEQEKKKLDERNQRIEELKKDKLAKQAAAEEQLTKDLKAAEERTVARQKEVEDLRKKVEDKTQNEARLREIEKQKQEEDIALTRIRYQNALQMKQQEEVEKQKILKLEMEDADQRARQLNERNQQENENRRKEQQRRIDQDRMTKESQFRIKIEQQRQQEIFKIERETKEQEQKRLEETNRQLQLQEQQTLQEIEMDAQKQKAALLSGTNSDQVITGQPTRSKSRSRRSRKQGRNPVVYESAAASTVSATTAPQSSYSSSSSSSSSTYSYSSNPSITTAPTTYPESTTEGKIIEKEEVIHSHYQANNNFPPLPYTYTRRLFFEGFTVEKMAEIEAVLKNHYGDRFDVVKHTYFGSALDVDYIIMASTFDPSKRKINEQAYFRTSYPQEEKERRTMKMSEFNVLLLHMPLRVMFGRSVDGVEQEELKKDWIPLFGEWIQYVEYVTVHPDYIIEEWESKQPNDITPYLFEHLILNCSPISKSALLPKILRDVFLIGFTDDQANAFASKMHKKCPHMYRFFSPDIIEQTNHVMRRVAGSMGFEILVFPDGNNSQSKDIWYLLGDIYSSGKIMTQTEFEMFNPNDLTLNVSLKFLPEAQQIEVKNYLTTTFGTHINLLGKYVDYVIVPEQSNTKNYTYYQKVWKGHDVHRGRLITYTNLVEKLRQYIVPRLPRIKKNLLQQTQTIFLSSFPSSEFKATQDKIISEVGPSVGAKLKFEQRGYLYNAVVDMLIFNPDLRSPSSTDNIRKDINNTRRPELTILSLDCLQRFGLPISVRFDSKFTSEKMIELKFHLHQKALQYSTVLIFPETNQPCDFVIMTDGSTVTDINKRNLLENVQDLTTFERTLMLT